MVRFSDIIKDDKPKEEQPKKPEKQSEPFRLSDLEELKLPIDKKPLTPPPETAEPPEIVEPPETTDAKSEEDIAKEDIDGIENIYATFLKYIKEVRESVVDDKPFEIEPALILINKIVNTPDLIEELYQFLTQFRGKEEYLISHSINTLVSALKISQNMGYDSTKLLELGSAALLYDAGMFKIPDSILNKEGKLTDAEVALIRKHPEMGRDLLSPFEEDHPWLPRVAYEHHENERGQGYPQGVKGDEFSEYAKIVGMVDTYEAMINNRPHRKAIMQHASVKELIWSKDPLFPSDIVKTFLKVISLYPVGSFVRLNNKATGIVTHTRKANPMKPIIRLLFDGKGNAVTEDRIINLEENSLLHIVDGVSAEDISR